MQPSNDRPLDVWSDDELVDQYRQLTGKGDAGAEAGDFGQLENIQEEMERRGLTPDDPSSSLTDSGAETDDDVIDPSSGAIPPAG